MEGKKGKWGGKKQMKRDTRERYKEEEGTIGQGRENSTRQGKW